MDYRFNEIAKSYETALKKYPEARTDAEWLIENLEFSPTDRVLEFTAGTGYLTSQVLNKIPNGHLVSQDIADFMLDYNREKHDQAKNIWFYLEPDPSFPVLAENSFDKAVCLGGFHHIHNQAEVMKTICSKLKPGGICTVGDFADNSPVQAYFDKDIHSLTATGHVGFFLSTSLMENLGRHAGFSSCETVRMQVPFIFKNEDEVGDFYQLVHGLDQDPSDTLADVRRYMGIQNVRGKKVVPMDYVYVKYTR